LFFGVSEALHKPSLFINTDAKAKSFKKSSLFALLRAFVGFPEGILVFPGWVLASQE
jgi:hypothetical protein